MKLYSFLYQIIGLLSEACFNVSQDRIAEIKYVADKARICLFEKNDSCSFETLKLPLYTYNGEYIKEIKVNKENQTVDIVPIVYNGSLAEIVPCVVLSDDASDWTIIHELCHLLSVGKYISVDDCFFHTYGIFEYQYKVCQGSLKQISCMGHVGVNEILNDYITWYFIGRIKGDFKPRYRGLYEFDNYIKSMKIDKEKLIGYYFEGNIEKIKRHLLGSRFESYKSFYEKITILIREGQNNE